MRMFGPYDHSAFDTLDHDMHRMRRDPWNPYFSKASVTRLQPLLLQGCVNKLLDRLAEYQAAGEPVVMTYAYACLTADVISEYSFLQGYGFLDPKPGFSFHKDHYDAYVALSKISHNFKQFGWLYPMLDSMPLWITKVTSTEAYLVIREQQVLLAQTHEIAAKLGGENAEDYKETAGRPSMTEPFLTSPTLPPHEKTPKRIQGEAIIAMGAGTMTSTQALKYATYHILANPPILSRLLSALEDAIPDPVNTPPDLRTLESIDYLIAVLYESLWIFVGSSHRLQRTHPDRPILYEGKKDPAGEHGWKKVSISIPPGTPVSMSPTHIHEDESIFSNHYKFDPDRWLPLKTNGVRPQKYLVTFGRGSKQCKCRSHQVPRVCYS